MPSTSWIEAVVAWVCQRGKYGVFIFYYAFYANHLVDRSAYEDLVKSEEIQVPKHVKFGLHLLSSKVGGGPPRPQL